ncbi:Heat shock protein 71 kDa protein [Fasciola hepatica]|uniref:Heat shock protein 71 kDa protein n=1 Tax=Fasciola hepatica TaxID=6192 RepID=A0A4E0RII3_FASHE|nr:Heat shock protein 71 kDa protein [Fasciola hepatica]
MATIGIDFGTTYSSLACFRQNRTHVILDNNGYSTTPSVVSFTEDEYLIGYPAVEQMNFDMENTVYDIKRIIGRSSKDRSTREMCEQFSFDVTLSEQTPKVVVQYQGTEHQFDPEQIVALFLADFKTNASTYLQEDIIGTIVTVPASFNYRQREAIKKACKLAGLGPVQLLNESTAAAVAYRLDNQLRNNSTVLVYDLGGGTFDLSIMKYHDSIFDVIMTRGDDKLGGRDFDTRLMNHVKENFERLHHCDLSENKAALQRLRQACEKAKFRLSTAPSAPVKLPHFFGNISLSDTVQRATFERLNQDLFDRTKSLMTDAIIECGISLDSIDEVILVGGSTRIPRIRQMMKEMFPTLKLNCTINPNHVVAEGAAVYAAKVFASSNTNEQLSDWIVQDVNQLALGLEDSRGNMVTLIKPNSPLPAKSTHYATTDTDHQTTMYIGIYEGDHSRATRNELLDYYILEGIQPQPAGKALVQIDFELNREGMLTVTSSNLHTGLKVHRDTQTSRYEQYQKEIQQQKQQQQQDSESQVAATTSESRRKQKEAYIRLKNLLNLLKLNQVSPSVEKTYLEIRDWLQKNPSASLKEIESRIETLSKLSK